MNGKLCTKDAKCIILSMPGPKARIRETHTYASLVVYTMFLPKGSKINFFVPCRTQEIL